MIYLASLDEAIEDKLSRYTFIHDKASLAKIVCETDKANTIIFRKEFIEKYFTPTGFDEYCRGIKSLNPNLVIRVDNPELVETADSMTRKIINCKNMRDILLLASAHEKEFVDTILQEDANVKFYTDFGFEIIDEEEEHEGLTFVTLLKKC